MSLDLLHKFQIFFLKNLSTLFQTKKIKILTLSRFRTGLKCDSLLWYTHEKKYNMEISKQNSYPNLQFGQLLKLIQELFHNSTPIPMTNPHKSFRLTKNSLSEKKSILNAGFLNGELFTRNSILLPTQDPDKWDIIEAKYTSSIKKDFFVELAYQKYVTELSGTKVSKCYILYINSDYCYQENSKIDPELFFIKEDVSDRVKAITPFMKTKLEHFLNIIQSTKPPKKSSTHSCKSPKVCMLKDLCWTELKDSDIFELRESNYLPHLLLQSDIKFIQDIPNNVELSNKQKIQISCAKTKSSYTNRANLKKTFSNLKYPYYFLDFETINPPIPVFQNSKPFQHVPFLFSLHIIRKAGEEAEHYSYICQDEEEPREKVLYHLQKLITPKGSVICYNDVFEKRCIREATLLYPQYKDWFNSIVSNFFDLSIPFKNFDYYHPNQRGSATLKSVLPVLTDLDYKDLNINNGLSANQEFLKMKLSELSESAKSKVRKNLIEYCKLDTWAMVIIVEKLKELVA